MATFEQIVEVAESLGWDAWAFVDDGTVLCTYTAKGRDFNVEFIGKDAETAINALEGVVGSFEYHLSYETYKRLGNDGYGLKGYPYELREVLEDTEDDLALMRKLHDELLKLI